MRMAYTVRVALFTLAAHQNRRARLLIFPGSRIGMTATAFARYLQQISLRVVNKLLKNYKQKIIDNDK